MLKCDNSREELDLGQCVFDDFNVVALCIDGEDVDVTKKHVSFREQRSNSRGCHLFFCNVRANSGDSIAVALKSTPAAM